MGTVKDIIPKIDLGLCIVFKNLYLNCKTYGLGKLKVKAQKLQISHFFKLRDITLDTGVTTKRNSQIWSAHKNKISYSYTKAYIK